MSPFELAFAFAAVFGAAYLLGHNAGSKAWKSKFHTLSELSLKLIRLIEQEAAERTKEKEKQA